MLSAFTAGADPEPEHVAFARAVDAEHHVVGRILVRSSLPGGTRVGEVYLQSGPFFATVRQRTKITRGPGSRAAGLAMAFKLIQAAQDRWRAVNAPHLVALVRAGATFEAGKLVERPNQQPQPKAA